MMDMKSILGALLEAGVAPNASQRIGHAARSPQSGLGGLLAGLGGQGTQGRPAGGGDLGSLLGGLLGGAQGAMGRAGQEVKAGNPLAAGGIGALAGALLGGSRGSTGKGALGGAALAILGQIAMSAMRQQMGGSSGTAGAQPGLTEGVQPASYAPEAMDQNKRATLLLRSMINAAKADGQIDGEEMNRILGKLDEAGADQATKDFVLREMRAPLDPEGLAAGVAGTGMAAEVYAASLLAIRIDTPAERDYMDRLAQLLRLSPGVRQELHASLGGQAA